MVVQSHKHDGFPLHLVTVQYHEQYFLFNTRYCGICKKLLRRNQGKFCSIMCSNKNLKVCMIGNRNALGAKHTEEQKRKGGLARRGKKRSPKTIQNMKIANKEAQNRPEVIEKHRLAASKPENIEKSRQTVFRLLEEGKFGWPLVSKESYAEKIFREFLESLGAVKNVDFFQDYHVGRYWLDFAYLDVKHYIEIDGK